MSQNSMNKKFTAEELSQYDGKDGRKCYFAYKGRVYDVSDSFLWKRGEHQVFHEAGRDLTEAMENAPHGDDFIKRFPVVGELIEA